MMDVTWYDYTKGEVPCHRGIHLVYFEEDDLILPLNYHITNKIWDRNIEVKYWTYLSEVTKSITRPEI